MFDPNDRAAMSVMLEIKRCEISDFARGRSVRRLRSWTFEIIHDIFDKRPRKWWFTKVEVMNQASFMRYEVPRVEYLNLANVNNVYISVVPIHFRVLTTMSSSINRVHRVNVGVELHQLHLCL